MSGLQVKLAAAIVVVFLVAETSALLPNGNPLNSILKIFIFFSHLVCLKGCEKSLSSGGIISRKTFTGKEASFECEDREISVKYKLGFRVLRSLPNSPPPPALNRLSDFNTRAPAPEIF